MLSYSFVALVALASHTAGRISANNTHPAVLAELHDLQGCGTAGVCGDLAGNAIDALLANADECAQQVSACNLARDARPDAETVFS